MQDTLLFARTFLTSPKRLGSAVPSSRFLVEAVAQAAGLERAQVIVEYGPGVGTITRHLLQNMRKDAVLVAIEADEGLYKHLSKTLRDPRIRLIHGSAADVRGVLSRLKIAPADCIISGIPFSTLPPQLRSDIVAESADALRESGRFVVYQFTAAVLPLLRREFESVHTRFVLRNVLPARVFQCSVKRKASREAA